VFGNSTCIFYGLTAVVGVGLHGAEASRSHSATPQSVRLPWTTDQPGAIPLPDNKQHSRQTSVPRRDSNPQSQTHALARVATGNGLV